ncbi:MAG: hypothetical protein IJ344_06965 [Clostridia bacterium]|nr:hypothetical protein [Clostridia bacterium]
MSKKQLLDALEHLDEDLLEEHFLMKERLKGHAPAKRTVHRRRLLLACAVMALCLLFISAGAFALLSRDPSPPDPRPPESDTVSDRNSSGAQGSPLPDSTSSSTSLDVPDSGEPIEDEDEDGGEPENMTSTEWLEWLTNVDKGTCYPMAYSGGLHGGIRYNHNNDMDPSAFELWPYDAQNQEVSHNTHFHLNLLIESSEVNGTQNIGTEDYPYKWVVFYREMDSTGDYKKFEGAPWSAIAYGDYYLYRFDVYSAGFRPQLKEDGCTNSYHMIFLIFNQEEELVIWRDEFVDWTDSSEAFLQDAIKHGIVSPERYERLSAR